jgi:hypothetical protein
MGKTIGFEALNTAALVVHANQQIASESFDIATQRCQLRAILPIACKQNQTAHQWIFQTRTVNFGQTGTGNIDDERGV